MLVKMGLNNTKLGVILPQIAGNIGFAVVILTGFIQQLPFEVDESAYSDGATIWQRLLYLVFPMAISAFATTAILFSYGVIMISFTNDLSKIRANTR